MTVLDKRKSERINLRVSNKTKLFLEEAAGLMDKNLSDFLLEQAYAAAMNIIIDRRLINLNAGQWKAFNDILNRPVQRKAKLTRLLSERSVLD